MQTFDFFFRSIAEKILCKFIEENFQISVLFSTTHSRIGGQYTTKQKKTTVTRQTVRRKSQIDELTKKKKATHAHTNAHWFEHNDTKTLTSTETIKYD